MTHTEHTEIFSDEKPKSIIANGVLFLDPSLTKEVYARADDSFLPNCNGNLVTEHLPAGFEYDPYSCTSFKMRNVSPHDDYSDHGWQYSMFVVTKIPKREPIYLHVGHNHLRMDEGSWAVLNHEHLHSVIADHVWYGFSIFCRPIEKGDQ